MTICMNSRCHLMREHTPDECGWPAEQEEKAPIQTPDTLRAALERIEAALTVEARDRIRAVEEIENDTDPLTEDDTADGWRKAVMVEIRNALSGEAPTPEPCDGRWCQMSGPHAKTEVCEAPEPVDRAALRAAVGRMQGKSFDFDSRDFVLRADVLRLLTGGTERSGS